MEDLIIVSESTVRPATFNELNRVRIDLTPWDLSLLPSEYTQRCLVFPKPDSKTDFIAQLKSSLSAALSIFYPFAGRLATVKNDETTCCFFVDCDGSGVRFVHAMAPKTAIDDVLEPDGFRFLPSFFPMNGVKSYEGISKSLLAVQITELADGILIGLGYNHMVSDGSSFWKFVNTWSKISSEKSRVLPQAINLRGWFLNEIDHPIPISFPNEKLIMKKSLQSPNLRESVFHFTKEKIAELRKKANDEIGADRKISSLQALVSHLWRSITLHRGLNEDQETSCKLLIDLRRRLNPPLQPECFGNAIGLGSVESTVGEVLSHGAGWAGLEINRMVGSQTDLQIKKFAENWVKRFKMRTVVAATALPVNSVVVAGSPWFDVYGNDFGWGKPVAVRAGPGNQTDGKLVVYPGREEGSIEIQASLSPETLKGLLGDTAFLETAENV